MKKSKLFIATYIILTIIKLFTAMLSFQMEEDMVLVVKYVPTIKNVFYGREDYITEYNYKYSWYRDKNYTIIKKNADILTYSFIINIWWITTPIIFIWAICKFVFRLFKL